MGRVAGLAGRKSGPILALLYPPFLGRLFDLAQVTSSGLNFPRQSMNGLMQPPFRSLPLPPHHLFPLS